MKSVLLAGGGTAGHVAPLLATADALRRRHPEIAITVLGTSEGLESRLVPAAGYDMAVVPRVPLPRRPSADLLRLPQRLMAAIGAATDAIDRSNAEVVVGFGGYVSTPAYLAARRRRLPIVVHEGNARPGLANRLGAAFSDFVAVTFPETPLKHATVTGLPLRQQITTLQRSALRAEAAAHFGLDPNLPTILVTGGSLGALRLNTTFGASADDLVAAGLQVMHISGRDKTVEFPAGSSAASSGRYVVRDYMDRMDLAYAIADFVVCRSGAGTVCELTVLGLPAAYVPLPIGNGEQRLNAEPVVTAGGGRILADADCTPEWVSKELIPLVTDSPARNFMAQQATAFGIKDADERLVDMIELAARVGVR